ncbi:MAG: hypothetical protein JRI23_31490, partial [Deltaproteobacteria bacterium]|jgi:thiol:disulfide interchange protein|nr:hypothetical protein [Deltaproteobacteria bacterium]MBW2536740.1 hypothetical protein [Deltaproteobacteria bacterium]
VAALELEREVWKDPRVARAMRPVVGWWVDVTAADEGAELAVAELRVDRIPTLLLLDPRGRELGRLDGGLEAPAVLRLLERAAAR